MQQIFLKLVEHMCLNPANTNIIKNRVGKKLNKFCQKVAIFVFKLKFAVLILYKLEVMTSSKVTSKDDLLSDYRY